MTDDLITMQEEELLDLLQETEDGDTIIFTHKRKEYPHSLTPVRLEATHYFFKVTLSSLNGQVEIGIINRDDYKPYRTLSALLDIWAGRPVDSTVHIMSNPCSNCLFSSDRIVDKDRVRDILEQCRHDGTHFLCHITQTTTAKEDTNGKPIPDEIICAGFNKAMPGNSLGQRLAAAKIVPSQMHSPDDIPHEHLPPAKK